MPGNSEDQMRKMSGSRLLLRAAEFPLPTSMAQWAVPITYNTRCFHVPAGRGEGGRRPNRSTNKYKYFSERNSDFLVSFPGGYHFAFASDAYRP